MEIRTVNNQDLRDFAIDKKTAEWAGIRAGLYTGFSKVFDSGMMILLKNPQNGDNHIIFICFSDITKNPNTRNLVSQVFPDLFGG